MSATLRLTREGAGIELRRGPFDIWLDGKTVGTINRGETVDTSLDTGHHTLRIHAGRYSSRPRTFDSIEGQVVNFRCHGAMMWPRYVASSVKPDLAIALHRE